MADNEKRGINRKGGKETLKSTHPPASEISPKKLDDDADAARILVETQEVWDLAQFLSELTSYQDNPNLPRYRRLIANLERSGGFHEFGDQYSTQWESILQSSSEGDKEKVRLLREKIKGKIVVDLGGGSAVDDNDKICTRMQKIVEQLGAKVYVNVDRYFRDGHNLSGVSDVTDDLDVAKSENMPVLCVEADILEFISRMRSASPDVVLVLNGIDGLVIQDHTPDIYGLGDNYHKKLAGEIARVLPRDGSILVAGSEDATEHFLDLDMRLAPGYTKSIFLPQMWNKK